MKFIDTSLKQMETIDFHLKLMVDIWLRMTKMNAAMLCIFDLNIEVQSKE